MSENEALGSATEAGSEDSPKVRRATRTRRVDTDTATTNVGETAQATTDAAEAPKPVRRTRAKKAADDADAVVAAADQTSEVDVAPKPARRGRPRKVAPEAGAQSGAAEQKEGADAAPKPARRGRPRKVAPEVDTQSDVSSQEGEAEAAPKPARRGRPRKVDVAAAEDAAQSVAADASSTEAEVPAAPKRKVGRPRKVVKTEDPAEGTSDEGAQETKANAAPGAPDAGQKDDQKGDQGKQSQGEQGRRKRRERDKQSEGKREDTGNANGKNGKQQDHNDRRNRRKRGKNQEVAPSVTLEDLEGLKIAELRARAAELELDVTGMKKADMVVAVYAATMKAEGFVAVEGVLDVLSDGYGFLRTQGYLPSEGDVYVGTSLIRRNNLRKGDYVRGTTRPTRENEKYAALQKVEYVNDIPAAELGTRVKFADLTPVYPDERLLMEHGKNTITARVIDLAAPIGKGQRGLIVSPPKAGKTTVLKDIAASITANNPEVHLMCLLVDERPEEVTDMQRSIKGEVVSSTFDMPCENHIAVAELVIERAKRLVELGQDVVILLDSLTRLARAYNLAQPASGRILSGGVDSTALYPPKRFLGAARNIEFGGSLTILASALVDTGSKMDEVIFEEFKGTGNMELKLDRNLADRRIFPAIDPVTSGTRKEDLLLDPQEAPLIWAVRRILSNMNNTERAMDVLIKSLKQTESNQMFLLRTAKKAQTATGKIEEL